MRRASSVRRCGSPWTAGTLGYGTSFGIEGPPETVTSVVTDVEVADDAWTPIPVSPVEPPRATIFVDGVRRIDARIWIDASSASQG